MQDLTTGPIRGHVLRMMAFMLVGMFTQTLYALVDIWWVGRLGKEAVAAVSIASNLLFVVLAVSQTLAVGAVALVSQAFGARDEPRVQYLFNQAQSLSLVAALLFAVLGFLGRDLFAERMAGDAATAELVKSFLDWYLPSQCLAFLMTGLGSSLRGIGSMRPGLVAQVGSVLLNLVLAPFLIFGWGTGIALGVAGAALATFIATLAAVLGLVWYLRRPGTYLRVNFAQWKPEGALWRRMLGIGLPSGIEFLLMAVIMGLVYWVIRPFGAEAQAGFGIGTRLMQAGFMPAVALSFALAAVAGQNFGARRLDRVRESFVEGVKLNVGFMLLFTVLCHLAPERMMGWFSGEPAVIAVGADYLRVVSWTYIASGLVMVANGLYQGLGNTVPSLLASASRLVTYALPLLWLARQPGFHLHQVWLLSAGSTLLQMLLSLGLLRREFRRRLAEPGVV